MIKSDITAYIGSYALDGVIEIPSRVLTSTVQDEEINLTYTPNFQLKLNDSYGYFNAQCMKVDFTVDSYEYSAYMYKVNSAADGTVTVQYAGGLEQGETPEPEPEQSVAPTMYYDENTFTVSATGEGTVIMYLDETEIENPYTFEQTDEDVTYIVAATAQQDGKTVSDIVSIDCFVPAATQPEVHTYTVVGTAQICGTDWNPTDANNDMVDEGDNIYSWLREGLQINNTSDARFQIVQDHSFDTMYPGEDYYLQLSDTGIYNLDIHFNSDTKEITATPTYVEPLPVVHTLAFGSDNYSCDYDIVTGESTNSDEITINYDGEPIDLSYWSGNVLPLSGMVHCAVQEIQEDEQFIAWEFDADYGTVGDYSDTVGFTYNGLTAYTTVSVTITETENEPDFIPMFYNQNGSSQRTVTSAYDVSGEDVTQSLNTNNLTENIPVMSSSTKYSIQIIDNNNAEPIALNENNFSMTDSTGEKTLAFWNSTYNTWVVDFQDENSQGLTAEDFLGDVIITVNDVQQTKSLPIIRPSIGTSFDYIYSATVGAQMIINLEGGNNKMYLVDAYAPGGTGGTYYKDIIVNDGQGHSMLIYNTDSNIADTTNFSTRPDTDFTGQSLTCKEMLSNGNRIKWIAGTIQTFRNGYQIQSSNLPAFTLDSSSTVSVDILYPETTSIGSIEAQNRYPIKIEAGTISALSANGSVEFTDPESGETVTINIYRVDTSTSTATYNGMVCTLTGIYDAMGNVIDWTSLTSNS